MADIVLVHGAFHGGWCWHGVAAALAAEGHRVARPTLTGLGERRHLLSADVDLETHVADIVNAVVYEQMDDLVLVCHSYGGVPGVVAADRLADRTRALVLLDAMLPIDGLSSDDLRERSRPAWSMERSDDVAVPPPSSEVFGISGADRARIDALLTPHPAASLRRPARLTGAYARIPVKHFHRARGYAAPYFDDAAARAGAEGGWRVEFHDLVHDMMLTDPGWTVAAIRSAVVVASGGSTPAD